MKYSTLILSILYLSLTQCSMPEEPNDEVVSSVNVFIGTTSGGNTTPAAHVPFGMISFGPTNWFSPDEPDPYISRAGYDYSKDSILNFSLTHVSGWGCHGALDIPTMPVTGDMEQNPMSHPSAYASSFSHERESAAPGYYEVYLEDTKVKVSSTVSERSAVVSYSFETDQHPKILFAPTQCSNGITAAELHIDTDQNEVYGFATSGGFCSRDPSKYDYTVHFVAQFNRSITAFGGWKDSESGLSEDSDFLGDSIASYVSFAPSEKPLEMKIAMSFVSAENARFNLEREIANKNLEEVKTETQQKWTEGLSKMQVETSDENMKTQLYTALYHNMLHPNIFEDVNGQYLGFNDSVYAIEPGRNKYVNFSNWDTYRTTAQLQGLLFPERASDMIRSLYLDSQQGSPSGFPIWGYFNNESWIMNGYSGLPLITNLYAFGGRDVELSELVDKMVWAADNKYKRGDDYIQHGYVPDYESKWNYSVSMTLEYAIADYGVAQMCAAAGDTINYQRFLDRSQGVFNLLNESHGYLQRKTDGGEWVWPFDSAEEMGFNEGNSAQYTWNIPHDYPGLVKRLGGNEKTIEKLDHFTSQILRDGWNVDQPFYWPANQPSFVAPYVYLYADAPEKTQALIQKTITTLFSDSPSGLPGNDDLGATSAMFLFQIAGFYPLIPGVPEVALSGSLVDKVTFHLDNGAQFSLKSNGKSGNKSFSEILIKGKPSTSYFIDLERLIESGENMNVEFRY